MTSERVGTGYLVVQTTVGDPNGKPGLARYAGVGRVPVYPAEGDTPADAIEEYVLGGVKDDETNLIPSFDEARRIWRMLDQGRGTFEILFCCEGPESFHQLAGRRAQVLGYDVAAIRADYWSIAQDFTSSPWAQAFRDRLNRYGLFEQRSDAAQYLREYRRHNEPDADSPLDIVFIVRVDPA